ncbi:MAG: hypothetical protein IH600_08805 [Bacteroidetes bacterium]|nr:hypothetical protein [Bacteroidota bacterium]
MSNCGRYHCQMCFALVFLPLLLIGCSDDEPTGPGRDADTTSHAFVWYTDTLGGWLSTVNDVFCLSENDAWAVGYFCVRDSTGEPIWNKIANAAHWDGLKWTLIRVNPAFNGGQSFAELEAVFCLSANDVWSHERHWNGIAWNVYDLNAISQGTTRKIWGDRPDHVVFAGDEGDLTVWNGNSFKQTGFQTTAANRDIWGWKDTMYVAVSDYDQQSGRLGYLMRFENGKFVRNKTPVFDVQIAVCGMDGTWYCGGCTDLYRKTGGKWLHVYSQPRCITGLRGTALNNVFILIQRGEIVHFNGQTFATILPVHPNGMFTSRISAAGTMVMAGGETNYYAIINRSYQQQTE